MPFSTVCGSITLIEPFFLMRRNNSLCVAPLSDPDWVAVKALCLRKGINETMDQLERIGARGIVAAPIRAARI